MVAISNKPPSVVRTPAQPEPSRLPQPAMVDQPARGWAATGGRTATPPPPASTARAVAASSNSSSLPIGPFATGVSMMAKAMLDESDPVSTSLASNAAVDQLVSSSMSVLQRELNDRGEMGAAIALSKQFAAIPPPARDAAEPMETVESNSERAQQLVGLLEKLSGAMGRIPQPGNDPTVSMQALVVASANSLVKAEVDLGLALNKSYAATGDTALPEKTQAFLEALPARVANGTASITDLGQKLKAKNELAAALINDFAANELSPR